MEKKRVPLYMDARVTFQGFGNSNYRSREVSESFRALDDAKIIQLKYSDKNNYTFSLGIFCSQPALKSLVLAPLSLRFLPRLKAKSTRLKSRIKFVRVLIYPGTSVEFPIVTDYRKSPRLQFLDTGLLNHALGIQADLLAIDDLSTSYKGALLPHLITQEWISRQESSYHKPHFWVRQKKSAQAELDLVLPYQGKIIPIEIKSDKIGKLRSLHQFMDAAPLPNTKTKPKKRKSEG